MSKEVDNKVVSMQFDNKNFENNVKTSMNTLDKLKKSLNLEGAAKGLENVKNAASKFDISPMSSGVEAVKMKFSALEVMAVTALANITNSAVNAGKRLVAAFTIDPIKTGFSEFELKMGSIQTIMAGTGESLDIVNKYLDELNKYSDQTIYSFADMTQNIGKFTNAGVNLKDSVAAIKGIANEAAVSGANANEASRAMYNFAQALSAGYVKLIDWKSIENANMATVEFKNELIKTAVEVGTLTKGAGDLYDVVNVVSNAGASSLNATRDFNDSLQNQWMTTEVLTKTLGRYADETTEIGKKAKASAQDVKTFSMMMDTLKEAAQSGWAQTWELIIGDFEQGKVLWTSLSNFFGKIIDTFSKSRNKLLEGTLGKNFSDLKNSINGITKPAKNAVKAIKDLGEIVDKVIAGSFGNGKERIDALTKAGYNYAEVQNKVNEKLGNSFRHVVKQSDANKQLTETTKETTDETVKLTKAEIDQIETLSKMSDEQLKSKGYTDKQIAAIRELTKISEKLGIPIKELLTNLDKINGRWLLLKSFENIGKSLISIFKAIGKAWKEVFSPMTSDQLFDIIAAFHKFTTTLQISSETSDKITNAFKGLFTVLKIVKDVIVKVVGVGIKLAVGIFKPLAKFVLDCASAFGKFISNAYQMATSFNPFTKAIKSVIDFVKRFWKYVKETFRNISKVISDEVSKWKEKFEDSKLFQTFSGYFEEGSTKIADALSKLSSYFDNFDFSGINNKVKKAADFLFGIGEKIANNEIVVKIVDNISKAFSKLTGLAKGFKLPKIDTGKFTEGFAKFLNFMQQQNLSGIKGGVVGIFEYLKSIFTFKFDTFKNDMLIKFSDFYLKYGDKIKAGFEEFKDVVVAIIKFFVGDNEISLPAIMDVVKQLLQILILIKVLNIVGSVSKGLESVGDGIKNIGKGFKNLAKAAKWKAIGEAFKSMAIALGVFVACMYIINKIGTKKSLISAGILLGIITVMGLVIGGLMFLAKGIKGGLDMAVVTGAFLALSAGLFILVMTLKEIDKMNLKDVKRSLGIMMTMLMGLAVSIAIVGKFCGGTTIGSVAAILTMLTALKMVLVILKEYSEYPWDEVTDAIPKMAAMLLGLSVALRIATSGVKAGAKTGGLALVMIAMVASLKILLGVVKDLSEMDPDKMKQGILGLASIMGAITIMLVAINLTNKGGILKKGERTASSFVGLTTALLGVCAAILILGKMDTATLLKGGAAVTVILGIFAFVMKTVGDSCKGLKTGNIIIMLVGMGLIIAELAIIVKALSGVGWQDSLGAAGSLSLLLLAMAGCLKIITNAGRESQPKTIRKWILALAALGLVVAELAGILWLMKDVDGRNAVGQVIALDALLIAMTGCLRTLTQHRNGAKSIYKWIGALATFGLVVGELAGVLYLIRDVDGVNALAQTTAISELLLAMSGCLIICSKVGLVAKQALVGLGVLAIAIGALALIVTIFGELATRLKGFGPVLDAGIEVMGKLGEAIGAFVGGIAKGLIEGISATLPQLGTDLSDFMNNAKGFFDGLNNIDASMIVKAGILTGIIGALETVGFINGINNLLTIGGTGHSLPEVGKDLADFITNATPFLDGVKTIDETSANGVRNLAAAIFILTAADFIDGLSRLKPGDSSLATFGTTIAEFGSSLMAYSQSISGLTEDDLVKIDLASTACKKLAETAAVLPRTGGTLQDILGEQDLKDFGAKIVAFGSSLISYARTVKGLTDDDITSISKSASAGIELAKLGNSLPRTDGWAQKVLGEKDLKDFGSKIVAFAGSLMSYAEKVRGLTEDDAAKITSSAEAATSLTALEDSIPKANGWAQKILGEKNMAKFGSSLVSFGSSLMQYVESIRGITDEDIESITRSKSAVEELVKVAEKIPTEGGFKELFTGTKNAGNFGTGMRDVANGLKRYIDVANTITEEDVSKIGTSKEAVEALVDVADAIPSTGDAFEWISGTKNISGFGTGMVGLANGITKYRDAVNGDTPITDDDVAAIELSGKAIKAVADAAGEIPNEGGLAGLLAGENNMTSFSTQLSGFAEGIMAYATKVKGITEEDVTAIENSATATKAIAKAAGAIPNDGGLAALLFGDNNMTTFSNQLGTFADGIVLYATKVKDISKEDVTAIDNSATAARAVAKAAGAIPNDGGVAAWLFGDNSMTTFSSQLGGFADGIMSYVNRVRYLTDDDLASIDMSRIAILGIINAAKILASSSFGDLSSGNISVAVSQITQLLDLANRMSGTDFGGMDNFAESLKNLGKVSVDGFIQQFTNATPKVSSAAKNMMNSFINAVKSKYGEVNNTFNTILGQVVNLINSKRSSFRELGEVLISMFVSGIRSEAGKAKSAISTMMTECADKIDDYYDDFYDGGVYVVQGLTAGIKAKEQEVYDAAYALGEAAVQGEKDGQESNSPSKATERAGRWLGDGLVNGVKEMGNSVYKAGRGMGELAVNSIAGAMDKVASVVNSGMNIQPTIRPVFDMDGVEANTIQLRANIDSYLNRPVASLSQLMADAQNEINTSNNRVIDAINGLREDLSTIYSDDRELALYMDSKKVASTLARPMNRELSILSKRGGL